MSGFLLNKYQMRTLLDMVQSAPAVWSPLATLPAVPRGCAPGEPDFEDLVEKGLVVREAAYTWRPNRLAAAALAAACAPDEIIGVKPSHSRIPGFAILRRGELVCECTVEAGTGDVQLVFPVSRSAVILRFVESLSATADEPAPTFSMHLTRDESFLLSVLVRMETTAVNPVTTAQLYAEAHADLEEPGRLAPFAAGGMLPDLTPASDLGPVFVSLEAAGVVQRSGTNVRLTDSARVLTEPVRAAFTITRVEVHNGEPRRDGMFVTRHGDRTLLLRATSDDDARLVLTEVTRSQLRELIAAFLLPREELAAWVAHEAGGPEPEVPATPSVPQAFCEGCGARLHGGTKFCEQCGRAVRNAS